jgi:hypothetical protein
VVLGVETAEYDVDVEVDGIAARYQVLVDVLVRVEVDVELMDWLEVLVLVVFDVIVDQLVDVEIPYIPPPLVTMTTAGSAFRISSAAR